jgi:hypothetical protein
VRIHLVDTRTVHDRGRAQKGLMKLYLALKDSMQVRRLEEGLMKTYLADGTVNNPSLAQRGLPARYRLRILLSYHYFKNANLDEMFAKYFSRPYPEVFLDSGAFSAFSQGATIDIQAYCDYIKRFKHLFTVYSNLDVIGSAAGTRTNQKIIEREGLSPLPVFHVGEDWQYLTDYIAQYPYIALGGLVPYMSHKQKKVIPWILRCFKMAQGKSVFHGFGCTAWQLVRAFPWYSVDSSSWGQGFRYGQVPLFDARVGKFVKIDLGNHQQCYKYAYIFRALGYSAGDFADRLRNNRVQICAISALSYIVAEQWLERRHGVITIPERVAL